MKYRPDVDGLRAFAILPVILFHAGFESFSGGYVGVDVFFVISGFLISRIVFEEISTGAFSLAGFYERRIRRIFPALFATLVVTTVAVCVLFLPRDLSDYSSSLIAAALSISNFYFLNTISYFDADSATKPLLHTWSLAVEEQFYVFLPVGMLLVWTFAKRYFALALWAVWVLSFLVSAYGAFEAPRMTFFMLPTRAWELLTGALVALNFVPTIPGARARQFLAALGLVGILISIFIYTEDVPFPGFAAALPVFGAALVLWCGQRTLVAGVMSLAPFRFIGLISYSLYLVHWPIISLYEYRTGMQVEGAASFIVVLSSIVLAYASWQFVEKPFRNRSFLSRRSVLATGLATVLGMSVVGGVGLFSAGLPQRFPSTVVEIANAETDVSPRRKDCHAEHRSIRAEDLCVFGNSKDVTTAVWGDSHGVELAYALGEAMEDERHGVVEITMSSCPPALGFVPVGRPACVGHNDWVMKYLADNPSLKKIVLVARYDVDAYVDKDALIKGISNSANTLAAMGRDVAVMSALPYGGGQVPRLAAFAAVAGLPAPTSSPRYADSVDAKFEAVALDPKVTLIEPSEVLCTSDSCKTTQSGVPLFYDDNHLSLTGARSLVAHYHDQLIDDAANQ